MIDVNRPGLLALALALFAATVLVLGGGPLLGSGSQPAPGGRTATPATSSATGSDLGGTLTDEEGRIVAERLYDPVPHRIKRKRAEFDRAHEIQQPTGFINTDGITISEFVGEKVVLLEFWTFGCSYCQQTHPHIKEWWREYRDDGLVVIGVHYPEFDYERKPANVREYVRETNTTYPVVLDNERGTWGAYGTRVWPTRVLIGVDGFVRYEHQGTYGYDATEQKIQELLAERDRVVNGSGNATTR